MTTTLREEAERILAPYNIVPGAVERIVAAYNEPWRAYHNENHILQMLELASRENHPETRQRLELLILYHDVWYKVGQEHGTNERNSAEWAIADFGDGRDVETARLTRMLRQGIIATATHTLDGVNPNYVKEVSLLLDLDLWGLGQSSEYFQANTEAIWREFQPIATRKQYDTGRAAWAKSFLARDGIYHVEPYLGLERKARENLATLID